MSRKFIASVVVAALTITAFGNAPARADDNLAQALAAIIGLAVVGTLVSNEIEDREKRAKKKAAKRKAAQPVVTRRYEHQSDSVIRRVEPRPLPEDVKRKLLPGDCLRSFPTNDGRARVFDKRCLRKSYAFTGDLPQVCAVKFQTTAKVRSGYDARCLRRKGYQLARQ